MRRRSLCFSVLAAALWLPVAARADVAVPGHRIVPSEIIFTGQADFPAYRFVVAVIPFSASSWSAGSPPVPTPAVALEGKPVSTSTHYFMELRAIPADAPDPVTDAWLASSHAPTSGSFGNRPLRVPEASDVRLDRVRYRVRRVEAGWVSIELISRVEVSSNGSERLFQKPIPQSFRIQSFKAPPGYRLFSMPDPSWPRSTAALPALPCAVGELVPLSPGLRTLVAVKGTPSPDGSLAGQPFVSWGAPLDGMSRHAVSADSAATLFQERLGIEVEEGAPLSVSHWRTYGDAEGRFFEDEGAREYPVESGPRWLRWAPFAGAGAGALAIAAFLVIRRRRRAINR